MKAVVVKMSPDKVAKLTPSPECHVPVCHVSRLFLPRRTSPLLPHKIAGPEISFDQQVVVELTM